MKKLVSFFLCALLIAGLLCGCSGGMSGGDIKQDDNTIKSVNLSETNLNMTVGDTVTLEVSVEPASAPKANLTWASDNDKVATVTDGIVKAISAGSAVVTVTTENGLTKSCNINVSAVSVKSITLDTTETTVNEGNTFFITATVDPSNVPDDELTWYSSDNKVAVVTNTGKVTAVSGGSAKISCRASNGVEANCNITVKGSTPVVTDTDDSDNNNSNDSGSAQKSKPDVVYVYLDRDPGGHLNPGYQPYESDFVFPYSSVTKLTDGEISAKLNSMYGGTVSGSYAQDAINEIYARNGYVFKTQSIYNYYASKPWYWSNPNFTINDFNSVEKYNIKLLTKYT